MKTNRRRQEAFYVYVVELRSSREVYVGSSALRPEERFEHHKHPRRYGSSHVVHKYGRRLRPDLSRGEGPYASRDLAKAGEKRIAHKLRARGYEVRGACERRLDPRCVL